MRPRIPVSTYRVQLSGAFGFADLRARLPYLSRLGVGGLYLSPCLQARPGSTHGYDICDHDRLSDELGGEEEFAALAAEAKRVGLGLVLDFVPNHMGVDPKTNRWWWDVLENGECSPFARFFDIDWRPIKSELEGKLLLAILGRPYGEVLEHGELVLGYDRGGLVLRYFDHVLPIDPRLTPRVLEHGGDALRAELGDDDSDLREFLSVLAALRNLPADPAPQSIEERRREREFAHERLGKLVGGSPRIARHVEAAVARMNGRRGDPASFDALHELLEGQAYRLAYWRTASHEINYRRFFDVNDLAGLRMEDPAVFAATHARTVRLVRDGVITGLRLDHVDGLFDPAAYLARLRQATGPCYMIVEKILTDDERLRDDWACDGTTGYEFLNELNGLFVDPRGEPPLRRLLERFAARTAPFSILAYVGKRLILETSLASELAVLADALNRISERDRRWRDFTLQSLSDAIREVVACFPAYRTYVDGRGACEFDRRLIDTAIRGARRRNPATDASIFAFLRAALLAETNGGRVVERDALLGFAMKFQQYTGPVQAKGLEDTAFYRYQLLVSLNEVGGAPQRFGRSVADFHAANRSRREHWPATLLATSTHDTKRSEDVRARIDAISEIADGWARAVARWSRINEPNRTLVEGESMPARSDELLFYQSLAGVWPPGADRADDALVERLVHAMDKSAKEAKLHTSWVNDDPTYDRALARFVVETLRGRHAKRFLASFLPLAHRIAAIGRVSSLAQVVLKLASPGVPDFYQGTELWALSLVDPDNRRPVDYAAREALLDALAPALDDPTRRGEVASRLLVSSEDGAIKLFVTALGLRARREQAALFHDGEYVPLEVRGPLAEHVVAFARRHEGRLAVAVAARLAGRLVSAGRPWPLGDATWADTTVQLPRESAVGELASVFTGELVRVGEAGEMAVGRALAILPLALLLGA